MSDLFLWLTIIGLTLVTIATRSVFLVLGDRFPLPERVQHALRYAPACALVALIAPELLIQQGQLLLDPIQPKLIAGLSAIATMALSRSMMLTIVIGMGTYWAVRVLT